MERKALLSHRSEIQAKDILDASRIVVLSAFVEEGTLLSDELGYGHDDIPLCEDLAAHLRETAMQHVWAGTSADFRVFQRAFVASFAAGLDLASQIHLEEGDGLSLDLDSFRLVESSSPFLVESPLAGLFSQQLQPVENAFTSVQNKQLAVVASTKDHALLGDFVACACLWSTLAGIEAGLCHLEGCPIG